MGTAKTEKRVFLASSGDVSDERDRMDGIVDRVNRVFDRQGVNVYLRLDKWENLAPGLHPDGAQLGIINKVLAQADLVVFLVWNRFADGVEEEAKQTIARWKSCGHTEPQILIYFRREGANLDSSDALKQRQRVLDFRALVQTLGLYKEYATPDEWAGMFEHLLEKAR